MPTTITGHACSNSISQPLMPTASHIVWSTIPLKSLFADRAKQRAKIDSSFTARQPTKCQMKKPALLVTAMFFCSSGNHDFHNVPLLIQPHARWLHVVAQLGLAYLPACLLHRVRCSFWVLEPKTRNCSACGGLSGAGQQSNSIQFDFTSLFPA